MRARTLDRADQAEHLAQAGDLVIRLGSEPAGKKLLDEAVRIGAKLGTDERGGYNRARIAEHLAVHDLPRRRKLVNGPTGQWANRYLSMLAMRGARRTDAKTGAGAGGRNEGAIAAPTARSDADGHRPPGGRARSRRGRAHPGPHRRRRLQDALSGGGPGPCRRDRGAA